MYTDFYNLDQQPFNLTPSPRFLYLGEVHKEALALLTYGVLERKGFILLTGEVGTGKTTIIQALLNNLDTSIQYIYLSNPLFSPKDFMNYLAFKAFKKKAYVRSKAEFLLEFESFLKGLLRHQENLILIIDEAQKLSFELLEEIRLLSNMETAEKKLINIFLAGQPELNEKLNQPRCRPLLQRISIRYYMKPLDLEGTREYIARRLKIAGAKDSDRIIPRGVSKAIYQYSQGYPRMINILADNALLLGYSRGKRTITPVMIKECYQDLQPQGGLSGKALAVEEPSEEKHVPKVSRAVYWKWVAVLLAVLIAVFMNTKKGHDIIARIGLLIPTISGEAPGQVPHRQTISDKKVLGGEAAQKEDKEDRGDPTIQAGQEEPEDPENTRGAKGPEERPDAIYNAVEPEEKSTMPEEEMSGDSADLVPLEEGSSWTTITVKKGDTVSALATRIYGWVDQGIFDLVKENNPEMKNIDQIQVGDRLVFPPLSDSDREPTYTVRVASFGPFESARILFQRLMKDGYEVYILPVYDPVKGKIFRVTVGNFKDPLKAQDYASKIKEMGISDYAKMIKVKIE